MATAMSIGLNTIRTGLGVGASGDPTAPYRRFAQPQSERAAAPAERCTMPPLPVPFEAQTPADLLAVLLDRMGGAQGSRAKGSYVNLRI